MFDFNKIIMSFQKFNLTLSTDSAVNFQERWIDCGNTQYLFKFLLVFAIKNKLNS